MTHDKPYMITESPFHSNTLSVQSVDPANEDEYDIFSRRRFGTPEEAARDALGLAKGTGRDLCPETLEILAPFQINPQPAAADKPLNIYLWSNCEALAEEYAGKIVVMAASVEEARQKARDKFAKQSRSTLDLQAQLEIDLQDDPKIIEDGTVLLIG